MLNKTKRKKTTHWRAAAFRAELDRLNELIAALDSRRNAHVEILHNSDPTFYEQVATLAKTRYAELLEERNNLRRLLAR